MDKVKLKQKWKRISNGKSCEYIYHAGKCHMEN